MQALIEKREEVRFAFSTADVSRILILAPHPDDETLGCGGVISFFKQKDIEVHIALFTNGEKGGREKNIAKIRRAEFLEVCNLMGVDNLYFLEHRDGELSEQSDLLSEEMKGLLDSIQPQYVFTPYIFDASRDHSTIAEAAIRVIPAKTSLFMYEVWTPILYPDYYINITPFYEKKREAMQCYKSQERTYKLCAKTEAINRMRAVLSMHRRSLYMECFRLYKGVINNT